MGATPEQLHRLGHHECNLCNAEKKTKAEERLILAALRFKKQLWNNGDGVCRATTAVMKERGMAVEVERKKK